MRSRFDHARGWVLKAESDLRTAEGNHKKVETDTGGKGEDYKGVGGRQASAIMGKRSTMAVYCSSR